MACADTLKNILPLCPNCGRAKLELGQQLSISQGVDVLGEIHRSTVDFNDNCIYWVCPHCGYRLIHREEN